MNIIATIPPYAPYIKDVVKHPVVSGIRLNTVMPVKESLEDVLKRLLDLAGDKEVWVDLKARQLRVTDYGVPPFTELRLSHSITVDTPTTAYFSDGKEHATVLEVDKNKLILQEGPQRVVGPGESVNIPHPSLSIDGFLTDTDKAYVRAGLSVGAHNYMLSFVESSADVSALQKYDEKIVVAAKIESQKGMHYVRKEWNGESRLMAARGDLYVELARPHHVLAAVEDIVQRDSNAIVASRIFPSLASSPEPDCQDVSDVYSLMTIGYRTFMLGDFVCMRKASIMGALNLFQAVSESYQSRHKHMALPFTSLLGGA